MRRLLPVCAGLLANTLLWSSALAQDESDLFAPAAETTHSAETAATTDTHGSVVADRLVCLGTYRSELASWTERQDNPLAKLRQSLDASFQYTTERLRMVFGGRAEYDPAYLYRRSGYDPATRDAYELRFVGGEAYVDLRLGKLEITAGRQIVAWGQGNVFSPADVPNPRDLREIGLAELDDLRLAVLATRVGLYHDQHRIELMVEHEAFFGFRPPPLAPMSPVRALFAPDEATLDALLDSDVRFVHEPPRYGADGQQLFGRYTYQSSALDAGVYGGWLLHRDGVIRLRSPDAFTAPTVRIPLKHPRYMMAGASLALSVGPLVLAAEAVYEHDRPLNTGRLDGSVPIDIAQRDAVSFMVGVSYAVTPSTDAAIEYAQSELFDDHGLHALLPPEQPMFALRLSQRLMRDRVLFEGLAIAFGGPGQSGYLVRGDASYLLSDALRVGVGYVSYQPGSRLGPIYGFDENDRAYAKLRYDFLLQ